MEAQRRDGNGYAGEQAEQVGILGAVADKLWQGDGAGANDAGAVLRGFADDEIDAFADVARILGDVAQIENAAGGAVEQVAGHFGDVGGFGGLNPRGIVFVQAAGNSFERGAGFAQ